MQEKEKQKHFGVLVVAGKYGLRLTQDNYAIVDNRPSFAIGHSMMHTFDFVSQLSETYVIDETEKVGEITYVKKRHYTDAWCERQYINCIRNYNVNMDFYANLDKEQFNKKINAFLRKYTGFKEVKDLKDYEGEGGYYLMVLDEYKQVYLGTTDNIKKRIQSHWRARKPFDRLLFGSVSESRLSIDSFRALDTTRIYVYKTWETYNDEDKYISFFPDEFVCNRIAGGEMELGTLQAWGTRKKRKLVEKEEYEEPYIKL